MLGIVALVSGVVALIIGGGYVEGLAYAQATVDEAKRKRAEDKKRERRAEKAQLAREERAEERADCVEQHTHAEARVAKANELLRLRLSSWFRRRDQGFPFLFMVGEEVFVAKVTEVYEDTILVTDGGGTVKTLGLKDLTFRVSDEYGFTDPTSFIGYKAPEPEPEQQQQPQEPEPEPEPAP